MKHTRTKTTSAAFDKLPAGINTAKIVSLNLDQYQVRRFVSQQLMSLEIITNTSKMISLAILFGEVAKALKDKKLARKQ